MRILALADRRFTTDGFTIRKLEQGKIYEVEQRIGNNLILSGNAVDITHKRYDDYLKNNKQLATLKL